MSGIIDQIQERTTTTSEQARVLEMEGDESDEVLDALSSETGRQTFQSLFEEPRTASELAERLDTSVQNMNYHLSNLQEAGLVEEIDTLYSEKGNEMSVYGPASDPLVFVGERDRLSSVRQSMTQVVSGIGLIGLASLLVQWGAERLVRPDTITRGAAGPASEGPVPLVPDGGLAYLIFEVIEPGVLFFFGTLLVASLVALSLDS